MQVRQFLWFGGLTLIPCPISTGPRMNSLRVRTCRHHRPVTIPVKTAAVMTAPALVTTPPVVAADGLVPVAREDAEQAALVGKEVPCLKGAGALPRAAGQ